MTDTQKMALIYAEKLIAYYDAQNSDCVDREKVLRNATNEMYVAQNALAYFAEKESEQ